MRVWITKYALTEGVQEWEVTQSKDYPNMVFDGGLYFHGEGRQWHKTERGAIEKAESIRKTKIKSLQKKIAKLEAMRFE